MLIRIVLFPFSFLYGLIVRFRNHLYNIGYSRSFKFDIPVIVVGNLSVGGSGKTPVVEYLVELLKHEYQPAILSRGYGRATKGFRIAENIDTSRTIGDEPMQFHSKWNGGIPVVVDENRVEAIPKILFERPDTNIILMDDGYQHRSITPGLALLLTPFSKPFYEDYLLPGGRLREPRDEASRADVVIVTKCNDELPEGDREYIKNKISGYTNNDTPVFFSSIQYGVPICLFKGDNDDFGNPTGVILLTGIANPKPLKEYVSSRWNLIEELSYRDHYNYKLVDLKSIYNGYLKFDNENLVILTTEKDAMRLKISDSEGLLNRIPIFYVPIKVNFIKDGAEFDQLILQSVKSN